MLPEVPDAECPALDRALASKLVKLSLLCVDREYPNKPGNIVDGDDTVRPPRALTPAFCGCFDWHSAVHGHWAMVRVLRRYPDLPEAGRVRDALNAHLTREKLQAELAYLKLPRNATFERPYGWGWLLRLMAELATFDDPDARRWAENLQPVAAYVAVRLGSYLDRLTVPVREGTHASTAFALVHALDYARAVRDRDLEQRVEAAARRFFGDDQACPVAYEPSGEDFLSPCLTEADLMRRVLEPGAFAVWLERLLPPARSPAFAAMLQPPEVRDRADPRIGHLIGLDFQKAWCLRGIASALPADHPLAALLRKDSNLHCSRGLSDMRGSGYGGEHWLASFAIYMLGD